MTKATDKSMFVLQWGDLYRYAPGYTSNAQREYSVAMSGMNAEMQAAFQRDSVAWTVVKQSEKTK